MTFILTIAAATILVAMLRLDFGAYPYVGSVCNAELALAYGTYSFAPIQPVLLGLSVVVLILGSAVDGVSLWVLCTHKPLIARINSAFYAADIMLPASALMALSFTYALGDVTLLQQQLAPADAAALQRQYNVTYAAEWVHQLPAAGIPVFAAPQSRPPCDMSCVNISGLPNLLCAMAFQPNATARQLYASVILTAPDPNYALYALLPLYGIVHILSVGCIHLRYTR